MNNVVVVQIIDGFQHLSNGLGSVLLRELALFADTVEQLATRGQLGDNVVFVLMASAVVMSDAVLAASPSTRTSRGT